MRRSSILLSAVSMLLLAACEPIELESETAAYLALLFSPPGAFAPIATAARTGEAASSSVSFRYGRAGGDELESLNNFGVTADFAAGTGRVGITAGATTCDGCDPLILVGGDWTLPLVRRPSVEGSFGLGLTTAVGVGIPTADDADGLAFSGTLGLPVSMIAGSSTRVRVIPYITPAIGFGALTGEGGASGMRALLGGGIGVAGNGFGVSAGVQKVFIDGGEAVFGLALTMGGRPR